MPRALFNGSELDQNFQIEDGVRSTLRSHAIAQVPVSVVEDCYDLFDGDFRRVPGTLEEKCGYISRLVGAEFEVRGECVWFRRV